MERARGTWTDERLDDRFRHIDERFDHVDTRFDRVDVRFDRMEADIRGMRSDLLQRIDTQSETLTTRIDTQGEALTARIDTLSGNFNALHRLLVQIAAGGILTILVAILSLTLTRS